MAIVKVGDVILQVPRGRSGWSYRESIRQQIGKIMIYVVEQCFQEVIEAEVTRALGRKAYQRRKQAAFGPSNGECGRCHRRDRRKFSRNGHYTRYLDTVWGRMGMRMPQVRCDCGGAVQIPYQVVLPYQRFWEDVNAQVREWYGLGLSLRQVKAELDMLLATSVGLRKLNEAIIPIAHLAPRSRQKKVMVPPVVRLDGVWIKLMEPTSEERIDLLGRCRRVKTGVSRPILVAQGVWPGQGCSEILAWQLDPAFGTAGSPGDPTRERPALAGGRWFSGATGCLASQLVAGTFSALHLSQTAQCPPRPSRAQGCDRRPDQRLQVAFGSPSSPNLASTS
jgi:hypothetical protein